MKIDRKKIYETEKEALAERDRINSYGRITMDGTYCPLSGTLCRTDCVCFEPVGISQRLKADWSVACAIHSFECNN